MKDLNLGQLLHALLHDISPWDKDGWRYGDYGAEVYAPKAGNKIIACVGDGPDYTDVLDDDTAEELNAAFIAASPATVGRLIKGMVELEIELYDEREETCQRQPGYWDWRRGHVLTELGISASDWKILLERLGDG